MGLKNAVNRSLNEQTSMKDSIFYRTNFARSENARPVIKDWWISYQKDIINSFYPFVVYEKGRRTGVSEAHSFRQVVKALRNEQDTFYSTYNLPSSKVFIKKCAKFAKAFNEYAKLQYNTELIDEKTGINDYSIKFNNGRIIQAIPDTARNFRDKESFGTCIIKDEAALSSQLKEIIEAVKALNLWGGNTEIRIISTHFGEDNYFNQLVQELKADPELGTVITLPFELAIEQGLYRKICELSGKIWTPESEAEYIRSSFKFYGEAASQELSAIPKKYGSGQMFHESLFKFIDIPKEVIDSSIKYRGWDFAATEDEKSTKMTYYTATILFAQLKDGTLVALQADARRLDPGSVEEWIRECDRDDDALTTFIIEEEPGSTGKFFSNHISNVVKNHNVIPYAPPTSKVVRAQPVVKGLKNDSLLLWENNRRNLQDWMIKPMTAFDGKPRPLANDVTDVTSMVFNYINEDGLDWLRLD